MTEPLTLTKEQARRYLLVWQGLAGPRRFTGPAGVMAYVRQAGCLQFDPVDVCGRNADMVLLSRVKGYRMDMLETLLYRKRQLLDHWDKNMAIYPAEDWPGFHRSRRHPWGFGGPEVEAAEAPVLERLAQGPASTQELKDALGEQAQKIDWAWSPTHVARAAAEALFFQGKALVHHKSGTTRYYAPASSCLPADLLAAPDPRPQDDDYYAWHTLRRVGALGLLWNRPSHAFLAIPDYTAEKRAQAFALLEEKQDILPCQVEGVKERLYLPKTALPVLEQTLQAERLAGRVEFIAPLDNLMWDRRLIEALFGFQYKWEVYTPAAKRQYGHYVLPVLAGTAFVGRIELRRQNGALEVVHYWPEAGRRPGAALLARLRRRIEAHAVFLGVPRVVYQPGCGIPDEG